ncbi:MAG: cytochrome c4 [Gammaproteobacteria bacterium]|nr:cytochrome c4 [Gammaproteobacteria bacterium]
MKKFWHIGALILNAGLILAALAIPVQAAPGSPAKGQTKVAACAGCHGADGNGGADPVWPRLAGQEADYIAKQLADFKSGARRDPIMAGMAAPLSAQDMKDIGAHYASLKPKAGAAKSVELAKLGEKLYRGGNAKTGVSACMSCHGPSGHGIPPRYPRVSAQSTVYTEKQMLAFKSGARANDGDIMTRIAFRMSEHEIRAVADYMAGLH